MPEEHQKHESRQNKQYIQLTRERFESIKKRRYQYLVLYAFICVIWTGSRIAQYQGYEVPTALDMATIVCQVLFYIQFITVMVFLGYSFVFILGACIFVFLPIPGLLILAIIDRRIAQVLNDTDEALEGRSGERADSEEQE